MEQKIEQVRFRFATGPDYRIHPVNGAWASLTANGTIQVDLFVERIAAPQAIVQAIVPDGLGPEQRIPQEAGEREIERQLMVGMLVTPDAARAIAALLVQKADELERIATGKAEATKL